MENKSSRSFEVIASIKADLTGFKDGIKEMMKDIKEVTGGTENISPRNNSGNSSGGGKQKSIDVPPGLEKFGSYLNDMGEAIERMAERLDKVGINGDHKEVNEIKNLVTQLRDTGKNMKQASDELKKNSKIKIPGSGDSRSEVGNASTLSKLKEMFSMQSMKDKITEMKSTFSNFRENPRQFTKEAISNRITSIKDGIKGTFSPESIKDGIQKMREFNQQMKSTNEHGEKFSGMFKKDIPDGIKSINSALDGVKNSLKLLFTMYAGKKLFDFTLGQGMEFEQYQTSFENIYKGNKAQAKAKMDQLTKYADTTPFETPEVMEAGINLGTVGMNDEKWIKLAGDLASLNKGSGVRIQDTSNTLRNIYTGNYGLAREELRNYQINDTDLAKYGVRFSNTGEWKSSASVIRNAVEQAIKEKAGGKTEALGQTASGMLSTIHDSLMAVGRDTSTKLFDDYKSSIKGVLDILKELGSNGSLKAFSYAMANALKPVIDGFKNLVIWIANAVKSGKALTFFAYVATAFNVLGIIIKSIIIVIKNLINILSTISGALSRIGGSTRSASNALYQLVTAFVAVKVAMIAFRNQALITGFLTGLISMFKALKNVIMGTTSAVQILKLAFKALSSGSWVGLLITLISGLLFAVMQLKSVKDAIGGLLNKMGLGQLAGILGIDPTQQNDPLDKMIADAKKQMDDDAKKAKDDANKPPDPNSNPNIDKDPYTDNGADLRHQLNTAIDDIDIKIRRQELTNDNKLQDLSLQGKYTDSGEYLKEDRSGLQALSGLYKEAMGDIQKIINKANEVEDIDTKIQAQMKMLEYQQKQKELLLRIANNTDDLKNVIQMTDLRNNKVDLQKDISMQNMEINQGTRPDTFAYWTKNREWLKKQMEDYRSAYERIKSFIPTLNGEEKIQAEIKALEYQKKANELLLEIKKNTDPRNGTFNLPSDIRSYSLFEDRQKTGKSGMVVSGNNFLIQVKELVQQEQIQDLMDRIQEVIYERSASDVRR